MNTRVSNCPKLKQLLLLPFLLCAALSAQSKDFIQPLTLDSKISEGEAALQFIARFFPNFDKQQEAPLVYTVEMDSQVNVTPRELIQNSNFRARLMSGKLTEIVLKISGEAEIENVSGDGIASWSERRLPNGAHQLVVVLDKTLELADTLKAPLKIEEFRFTVVAQQKWDKLPVTAKPLAFSLDDAALLQGQMKVDADSNVVIDSVQSPGLLTVDLGDANAKQFKFSTSGKDYSLSLALKTPLTAASRFSEFGLTANWQEGSLKFDLQGEIIVDDPNGADLLLLDSQAAFLELPKLTGAEIIYRNGAYRFVTEKAGRYPISGSFIARADANAGRSRVQFVIASSAMRPLRLKGFPIPAKLVRLGELPVEQDGADYIAYLPPSGMLNLAWTDPSWQTTEEAAKLFYSAESQIETTVGVGVMRQRQRVALNILQGGMRSVTLWLDGEGEITRLTGPSVLNWKVGAADPAHAGKRPVEVTFNREETNSTMIDMEMQTALGEFPVTFFPPRVTADDAIRTSGFWSLMNMGAVELSPQSLQNLAQIAPEFLPEAQRRQAKQLLAYRFSGNDYRLELFADNILPEIAVSQILIYRLGENDQSISAELECDIRRAPIRDFHITLPAGYSISRVEAPNLADYFVTGDATPQLRLVFSQPMEGKRVIRLTLERNDVLTTGDWPIPYLAPQDVKSVRGHIGVAAGPGLRLNVGALEGVAEQVAAYFPQRIADLRLALRLRQPDWSAQLTIEKLSQSVQAESFHLVTLAEGALYGSTIINYAIGDAPVDTMRIRVPVDYQNVNFSGPNIRSWEAIANNEYQVNLQRAQTGAYTLLVTYEAKFAPQGARLGFGQIEPLGVESEQGYIVASSDFPFDIANIEQSPGLIPLEPNEVPAEFRLLYESQVLAAFQYTRRPLTLSMDVAPFKQGQTVNQVVDFTELKTQISGDGELLTTANYQLKSKGHAHFRLTLPPGSQLWSVTVLDQKVTPAADGEAILIPLPAGLAADAPISIKLQWAARAQQPQRPTLTTPQLDSPALLINWTIQSDPSYGLQYLSGNLRPTAQVDYANAWTKLRDCTFDSSWLFKLGLAVSAFFILVGFVGIAHARNAARPKTFLVFSLLCLALGIVLGAAFLLMSTPHRVMADSLKFVTPLEQSTTDLHIQISNLPRDAASAPVTGWIGVALGVVVIGFSFLKKDSAVFRFAELVGWLMLLWGALNISNHTVWFALAVLLAMARFLYVPARAPSAVTAALVAMLALIFQPAPADAKTVAPPSFEDAVAEITQTIEVGEQFAVVNATLTWDAEADEIIHFLREPLILQSIDLPKNISVQQSPGNESQVDLLAQEAGRYTFTFSYRVRIDKSDGAFNINLPISPALVNRTTLNLPEDNFVVQSNQAVQVISTSDGGKQSVSMVFSPSPSLGIRWAPKKRDAADEDTVYFAESYDVYQPLAGIVEGAHRLHVRPSQGVIEQLTIQTPPNLTITTVQAPALNNWRFDPERRAVDLFFQPGHTTDFLIDLRSQYTSQPLPYTQAVEPLKLLGASDQISLIALATNEEIQIGEVTRNQVSAINLEDFPQSAVQLLVQPGNEPVVRRAFRWTDAQSSLSFEALAVLPDIRVTTTDRVSYGEDRTLLSSSLNVVVNRAGVFQLSFIAPDNFDIESISGPTLSHWNETTLPTGERLVTLQLERKLLGAADYALTLSGPGLSEQTDATPPRILLSDASRQVGAVAIFPELGYRLSATERRAVSQLDPKTQGIHDARAQLFRYLNQDAALIFKVDVVPPWIEVQQHQSVTIRSGIIENAVRALFTVENAGVRELLVQLPADSLGVRFTGDALDRFEPVEGQPGQWRLRLDRKRIDQFLIEADYQRPTPQQPDRETITGFQVLGVNQTTGALSLATQGRLELSIPQLPDTLQRGESQMIPPRLRFPESELGVASVYRVLEPDFSLAIQLIRRDTADTLPAQVKGAQLMTVIADSGAALTRMRIQLDPGAKRLLRLQLPADSEFWYAFVNSQSTWPWREGDDLILQLEAIPGGEKTTQVEFFYSQRLPVSGRGLNEQLVGPRIDLPMEAIEWQLFYPESWRIDAWTGNLTLDQAAEVQRGGSWMDLTSYTESSSKSAQKKTDTAKTRLAEGNRLLETGDQVAARKAFEDAYNLSENDMAFNEDARVQLQTLREQQAIVGITQRRNMVNLSNSFNQQAQNDLPQVDMLNYRQEEAQQLLQGNTMDDNAALREVAREVLQQQQAALVRPQALLTALPEQGKTVRFTRSLQVDDKADLVIQMSGSRQLAGAFWQNLALIAVLGVFLLALAGVNHVLRKVV